jgi:hypothetical protein
MKRPVSCAASLLLVLATVGACSAAKAGKTEFAEVCEQKMGGAHTVCACYVDSILAELNADQFYEVAQGAVDNRRFSGIVPESLRRDAAIDAAVLNATESCMG